MLTAHETLSLNVPASDVWAVIGKFGALADWHPAVVTCNTSEEGGSQLRTVTISGGGTLIERLDAQDEAGMSTTYSIVDGPLPVANYQAILKVVPDGDGCTIDWSGRFDASGVDDDKAIAIVRGVYTSGLGALKERFG